MSKEVEQIDSEILISLVQDKPEIWDKAAEDYKNRNKKTEAWRSICAQLKEHFENLSDGERKEFGQLVLKRWNNIRDQWLKWRNRDKNSKKSGAAASKLRKYLYHEQLNFLEQGLYHRSTDASMAYEHSDEAESQQQTEELQSAEDQGTATPDATKQTSQTPTAKIPSVKTTSVQQSTRKRKRTLDEFELRMLKSVEAGDQEDRHMQFFKGILPSVQKFTDNQVVDF
ncbi:unnamed protein product [Acanthoscelides obtectus]|uniref:MADF domain-containing protein n=1 Tax=Acanthoscelides obtectus TaxID=200917 RepID=A0A9P0PRK6_ACAOB|nr:unnamed protein product [Acanthoscelides obtectus]CAK1655761.1 hypothetical protein AOBTE_LOCUS19311 [Acanthoscelides obtectus]